MYLKMNLIWGPILVGFNNKAEIFGLWFEGQKYFPDIDESIRTIYVEDKLSNGEVQQYVKDTNLNERILDMITQLREYEKGERRVFNLKLSPLGTDFRQGIWRVLQDIEYGERTTYGNIAKEVAITMNKATMSPQAVGGAVGHNPISIIIPCHRVVGSDGTLTGYAGGVDKKEALLKHEAKYSGNVD